MPSKDFEVEVVEGVLNSIVKVTHISTGMSAITSTDPKPKAVKVATEALKKRLVA